MMRLKDILLEQTDSDLPRYSYGDPGKLISGDKNGTGVLRWREAKYDGQLKDGQPSGKGTMQFVDYTYKGTFAPRGNSGVLNGIGEWKDNNGNSYRGFFENNSFHGTGIFKNKHGIEFKGMFRDDKWNDYTLEQLVSIKSEKQRKAVMGYDPDADKKKKDDSKKKSDKFTYTDANNPISLSDTDPWEYYMDSKTETWYTRRKGNEKWIDMEENLSAENWKIALDRLNSYIKKQGKTVVKKSEPDKSDAEELAKKSKTYIKFDPDKTDKGDRIYIYSYKKKKFENVGTYKLLKDPEQIQLKYLTTSTNKQYILVQFVEEQGKPKYWIPAKFLQDKNAKPQPKPKPDSGGGSSERGQHGEFYINSPFGPRVLNGVRQNHKGLDIRAVSGTPIELIKPGKVYRAGNWNPRGWGNTVEIIHDDGTMTRYAHLSKINVKPGQDVAAGTVIALTGGDAKDPGPGNSTNAHLHWEWMPDAKRLMGQENGIDVVKDYFRFQ